MGVYFGPYVARLVRNKKQISYVGNKIFKPIKDVKKIKIKERKISELYSNIGKNYYYSIHKIGDTIFSSAVEYFRKIGAEFVMLPIITRMISSPGAALKEILLKRNRKFKVTSIETVPVSLDWFNYREKVFLSESSQLYLELTLALNENLKHVFSIYNSFRKECSDQTHLCEFHHIEYEGKVDQSENQRIIRDLIIHIVKKILEKNERELKFFLNKDDIRNLETINREHFSEIPLSEVLEKMYADTGDKKYLDFTSLNFGWWEEVRITELEEKMVFVKEFPIDEVPFYQAAKEPEEGEDSTEIIYEGSTIKAKVVKGRIVANNADLIASGYREIVGSGHRVRSMGECLWQLDSLLNKKMKLPKKQVKKILEWYEPYVFIRGKSFYRETSGFGLGIERFMQWLLKTPTIVDVTLYPRLHFSITP